MAIFSNVVLLLKDCKAYWLFLVGLVGNTAQLFLARGSSLSPSEASNAFLAFKRLDCLAPPPEQLLSSSAGVDFPKYTLFVKATVNCFLKALWMLPT